ncbi:hypothetical protein [Sporosalibacterium faouarense]|uniref:hypothetical protein n=1 Tax=Sporosalibacterium faouarense TaxID=516123 RepID=UPI00192BC5C5|nr:hypothetical protein [Sporosalibacterium faouarense]
MLINQIFFDLYNNYQLNEKEMLDIIEGIKALLLQMGENFTDEGILSALIEKKDLENRDF